MSATKQFAISKHLVMEAFKAVKVNSGAAGIDLESISEFENDLKNNLYKIWNRMSSGSYFPPPVKAVAIPKKGGGERILGVPTVSDRVAQTVVKMTFEPIVESVFLPDSYGYRPGRSALDAVSVTRQRCWKYNWVLEFDIKGLFDNIDHELLMRAVQHHTQCKWVLLYIERWLKAPMQMQDGSIVERRKGTPQGGVVSPCLANLFLHYVFDVWLTRNYPEMPWCRYADDGLVHCKTELEAKSIRAALEARLAECGLTLHPDKTQVVYCKDSSRRAEHSNSKFTFLGYMFRPRLVKTRKGHGRVFVSFSPAVSPLALKAMRQTTRKWNFRNRTNLSLSDIAKMYNPVLRGWYQYYGKFYPSALGSVWEHFNKTLVAWAMRKYKALEGRKVQACLFLERVRQNQPQLFIHWKLEHGRSFA